MLFPERVEDHDLVDSVEDSGRNEARNDSIASFRARSGSLFDNSKMAADPTLLVITRTVFRKSTYGLCRQ